MVEFYMSCKDLMGNCIQPILLILGMTSRFPCSSQFLSQHCLLIHWTGFSDTALLAIAEGPGAPVPGRANQMIPPWNLPLGAESEGKWSIMNVST